MIKLNGGIEKEKIINIEKFELYWPLIECIICKKISFPPYECVSCSRCICKNCGETCPLCNKKLIYYPSNIKKIYKGFKIKDDIDNTLINIDKYEKNYEEKNKSFRNIDISRQELIVSIERNGRMIIPDGSTEIKKDDVVLVYRKGFASQAVAKSNKKGKKRKK